MAAMLGGGSGAGISRDQAEAFAKMMAAAASGDAPAGPPPTQRQPTREEMEQEKEQYIQAYAKVRQGERAVPYDTVGARKQRECAVQYLAAVKARAIRSLCSPLAVVCAQPRSVFGRAQGDQPCRIQGCHARSAGGSQRGEERVRACAAWRRQEAGRRWYQWHKRGGVLAAGQQSMHLCVLTSGAHPYQERLEITPKPGFVIKTQNAAGVKVFINVCHSDQLRKPSKKKQLQADGTEQEVTPLVLCVHNACAG